MNDFLQYDDFIRYHFDECKTRFDLLVRDCSELDIKSSVMNEIIGEIHRAMRKESDAALQFFWSVFLVNPLIAIKACQEANWYERVDYYLAFKHPLMQSHPIENVVLNNIDGHDIIRTFNPCVENYLIFCIEAILQSSMPPLYLLPQCKAFLEAPYTHDKAVMANNRSCAEAESKKRKWITHRNLEHIISAIDPHHVIILLAFFTEKYSKRLYVAERKKERIGKLCYSGDKYEFLIHCIKKRYGSLSEYINWDKDEYLFFYLGLYQNMIRWPHIQKDIDVIFATVEDKKEIAVRFQHTLGIETKAALEKLDKLIEQGVPYDSAEKREAQAKLQTLDQQRKTLEQGISSTQC